MARVGGLGGFLVLVAIIFGFKFMNRAASGDEVLRKAHTLVQRCDCYDEHGAYLDGIIDWAHDDAFEASYEMSYSRRRASTFDEDQYFFELFTRVIDRCKEDKADDVAESVAKMCMEEFGDPS